MATLMDLARLATEQTRIAMMHTMDGPSDSAVQSANETKASKKRTHQRSMASADRSSPPQTRSSTKRSIQEVSVSTTLSDDTPTTLTIESTAYASCSLEAPFPTRVHSRDVSAMLLPGEGSQTGAYGTESPIPPQGQHNPRFTTAILPGLGTTDNPEAEWNILPPFRDLYRGPFEGDNSFAPGPSRTLGLPSFNQSRFESQPLGDLRLTLLKKLYQSQGPHANTERLPECLRRNLVYGPVSRDGRHTQHGCRTALYSRWSSPKPSV